MPDWPGPPGPVLHGSYPGPSVPTPAWHSPALGPLTHPHPEPASSVTPVPLAAAVLPGVAGQPWL